MTARTLLAFLFLSGFFPLLPDASAQDGSSAVQEAMGSPAEEKILLLISEKRRELSKNTAKVFQNGRYSIGPGHEGFTEKQTNEFAAKHREALDLMNTDGVLGACQEIAQLSQQVGRDYDCEYIRARIKHHSDHVAWSLSHMKKLEKRDVDEQAFDTAMADKDRANDQRADFLATEEEKLEERLNSRTKSLTFDGFLASRDMSNAAPLDDFLAADTPADNEAGSTNTVADDFLADLSPAAAENTGKQAFEIVDRDQKTGVVGQSGKTLIPFRNWAILNYQSGVAEVSRILEKFVCSQADVSPRRLSQDFRATVLVSQRGFVDSTGQFLDKPTISFYEPDPSPSLFLVQRSTPKNRGEYTAQQRAKERRRREARQAALDCRQEKLEFKNRVANRHD